MLIRSVDEQKDKVSGRYMYNIFTLSVRSQSLGYCFRHTIGYQWLSWTLGQRRWWRRRNSIRYNCCSDLCMQSLQLTFSFSSRLCLLKWNKNTSKHYRNGATLNGISPVGIIYAHLSLCSCIQLEYPLLAEYDFKHDTVNPDIASVSDTMTKVMALRLSSLL